VNDDFIFLSAPRARQSMSAISQPMLEVRESFVLHVVVVFVQIDAHDCKQGRGSRASTVGRVTMCSFEIIIMISMVLHLYVLVAAFGL
jgi:hypothetical protein